MKQRLLVAGLFTMMLMPAFAQSDTEVRQGIQPGDIPTKAPAFSDLDRDGNQQLTFGEVAAAGLAVAEHFPHLDTDKDRILTEVEYARIMELPGNGITSGGTMID